MSDFLGFELYKKDSNGNKYDVVKLISERKGWIPVQFEDNIVVTTPADDEKGENAMYDIFVKRRTTVINCKVRLVETYILEFHRYGFSYFNSPDGEYRVLVHKITDNGGEFELVRDIGIEMTVYG